MNSLAVLPYQSAPASLAQKSYAKIPQVLDVPSLIKLQIVSFEWFRGECLRSLFDEISPIQDFTGSRFDTGTATLHFLLNPRRQEHVPRQPVSLSHSQDITASQSVDTS